MSVQNVVLLGCSHRRIQDIVFNNEYANNIYGFAYFEAFRVFMKHDHGGFFNRTLRIVQMVSCLWTCSFFVEIQRINIDYMHGQEQAFSENP